MLHWLRSRGWTRYQRQREAPVEPPKPRGRVMSGKYLLLYNYLENRYATTVVLTFAEIEDLLGFTLPEQARQDKDWWTERESTVSGSGYSDSWVLASRTAQPNLMAQT